MSTHLVKTSVNRRVGVALGVNAKDLSDVDVGAGSVDLRVVAPESFVGDTVHLLDPVAGAAYQLGR